jgi:enoyl-CoA hydratase
MSELVLREQTGYVLRLVLNRPEKRNALNTPLRQAIVAELARAATDESVRVVVLTGSGTQAFVAGADVQEFETRTQVDQYRFMRTNNVFEAIDRFPKPIIAAINGVCLGGGLELALACDIRLAASTAQLGQPEVNIGLIPGGGGTQRLPRIVGTGAALKLILSGTPIDSDEALRLRLIDERVEPDRLLSHATALAERIASRGPVAVMAAKEAVRASMSTPLNEGLSLERALFQLCFSSDDKAEGVRAFLEKRAPEFVGR